MSSNPYDQYYRRFIQPKYQHPVVFINADEEYYYEDVGYSTGTYPMFSHSGSMYDPYPIVRAHFHNDNLYDAHYSAWLCVYCRRLNYSYLLVCDGCGAGRKAE